MAWMSLCVGTRVAKVCHVVICVRSWSVRMIWMFVTQSVAKIHVFVAEDGSGKFSVFAVRCGAVQVGQFYSEV